MRKSLTKIMALVFAMMMFCGNNVFAFYHTFSPPRAGSGAVLSSGRADGLFNPYMTLDVDAVSTYYFISPYGRYTAEPRASDIITTSTAGRKYFEYNSGYGGSGTLYYLQGAPAAYDFYAYTVSGSWKP